MVRQVFVFRDGGNTRYSGTSVERALALMPITARQAIRGASGTPSTVEDLWGNGTEAEPNIERVYHA